MPWSVRIVFLIILTSAAVARADTEPWQWLEPQPQGNVLRAAATDGKVLVAAGDFGSILTKPINGSAWQLADTSEFHPASSRFGAGYDIVWTGERFLIAGRFRDGLLASKDGSSWSLLPRTARLGVVDFAWDHTVQLAQLGEVTLGVLVSTTFEPGGRVPFIRSTDHGNTWAQGWLPQLPKDETNPYRPVYSSLRTHRGVFVLGGANGMLATSADGLAWSRRAQQLTKGDVRYLASNGQAMVAAAEDSQARRYELLRSTDGINWSKVDTQQLRQALRGYFPDMSADHLEELFKNLHIGGVFAAGNKLVVDVFGYFLFSEDGENWSRQESDLPSYQITWLGQLGGATYVLDERGSIGRLSGGAVTQEIGRPNQIVGWGSSLAGLGDIVVVTSAGNSTYAVSNAGSGFVERRLADNSRPMSIARIGDRLVIAARPADDWTSNQTTFYQSFNGLDWSSVGAGLIGSENLRLTGASVNAGPLLSASTETDYDNNGTVSITLHLYRAAQGLNHWEKLTVPGKQVPSADPDLGSISPPLENSSSLEPDLQWDGRRFILRNTAGELWQSADGVSWSQLPVLPDDSRDFLLATVWFADTLKETQGQLKKNYAGFFASNGDRLVVRPAKLTLQRRYSPEKQEDEMYWQWENWGADVFFVYDFNAERPQWRRVFVGTFNSYPVSYAETVWTGTHFVAASYTGRMAASSDGLVWTNHELRAEAEKLHWTGSRLVATNWRGGVLTHPTGLSRELVPSEDAIAAAGLAVFATAPDEGFNFYEINEDRAIPLRDARNRPLSFARFAEMVGGLMDFYFQDEPIPVPLAGTPALTVERAGRAADFWFSDFNIRSGAFLGVRRVQLNLDTGVVRPLPMLPARQLGVILEAETRFNVDFNADGVIGDVVAKVLGGGLYATASGALYYAAEDWTEGRPLPQSAVLLRDRRGQPLKTSAFIRGLAMMERGGGQPRAIAEGSNLRVAIPNYALPRGATVPVLTSLTTHSFGIADGRLTATRTILAARQLAALLAAETDFAADFNGDGVVGDVIVRSAGAGLYVTGSGAVYHSVGLEVVGQTASREAVLLLTRAGVSQTAAGFLANDQLLSLTKAGMASRLNSNVLKVAVPRFNLQTRNRVVGMSSSGQPSLPRFNHSQVWTGRELIVWGGNRWSQPPAMDQTTTYGDGAAYNPLVDIWTRLNDEGAPSPRAGHTAVWTGEEMIVWGGSGDRGLAKDEELDQEVYQDGAIYHPNSDTWRPMATGPFFRSGHTAVWTGEEMIVWGSDEGDNTGAVYNPATDRWRLISEVRAPSERTGHDAVWTGEGMAVWGGKESGNPRDTFFPGSGAFYNPERNEWEDMVTANAPWSGDSYGVEDGERSVALLWGNKSLFALPLNSQDTQGRWIHRGGIYDPLTKSWTPIETSGAPNVRPYMAAFTRDGRLFVGGSRDSTFNGLAYDFGSQRWRRIMSATTGSFQGRQGTWVPELDEMLVFGGMWPNTATPYSGAENGHRGFRLQLSTPTFASLIIHELNHPSGKLNRSTLLTPQRPADLWAAEVEFQTDFDGNGAVGRP